MAVSRIDILNQGFSKKMRGYDPAEVDRYMQDMADTIGRLGEDKSRLEARVADLEARLTEFREREAALRDTLIATQRMTEDMKTNAQREAQLIIDAAHAKAESLVNQGHIRLARLQEDILEAKKLRAQFEMKVRSVIDAHMQLLEMSYEEQKVAAAPAPMQERSAEGE
ncbi:DivIVA domain-containing protein [Oleidesulfovibrio sp.]|uniref:DivIVA domain-containing protein n=1 Tax=Oleidesulfovibrio sp. TaxID=2909707 RepID=UPI003A889B4C